METFNLAEAKILEREYCKEHLTRRLRIMTVLIVITLCVAAGAYACKTMVMSNATNVKSRLADAEYRCNQLKTKTAAIDAKLSQGKWQVRLADRSRYWLNALDAVLCSVPSNIWLSGIQSSEKEMTLIVEGHAASFESLSAYIGILRSTSEFSAVRLKSSRIVRSNNVNYVEFSLDLNTRLARQATDTANTNMRAGGVPDVKESP